MLRFKTVCQKWETENQKRELKKQRGILFCTLQAICPWVEADLVGAAKSSNRGQKPLELRLTWTKERRGGSGCGGVAGTALCPLCPANQSTLDQRDRAGFAAAGWSCMVCYLSVSLTVWLSGCLSVQTDYDTDATRHTHWAAHASQTGERAVLEEPE